MNEIIKINDWFYFGKYINEFKITPPTNNFPEFLNKYYGLSEHSLNAITNSYIYVNHPSEFNDPYDSVRQFTFKDNDSSGFYKFNLMFVNMGLISMSESSTNMLMWAHYSNHDGFLINFKIKRIKNKFKFILPMNYIDSLPDMRFYENENLKFMISTNLKSTIWKYEKEWRLYYQSTPMLLPEKLGSSYKDMNDKWIHQNSRKPKERKVGYKKTDINFISLGYKFIINEAHEKIDKNTVLLNISDPYKKKLIDYAIHNKISLKVITYGNVSEFGLKAIPIKISKIKTKFEYEVKYFA